MTESGNPRCVVFVLGNSELSGASRMGCLYAKRFVESGFRVVVACGTPPENSKVPHAQEELRRMGCEVREMTGFERLLDRKLCRRLAGLIRETRAGVCVSLVQIDVKIAALASRQAGVPLVVFAQNRVTFGGNCLLRWIKKRAYAWCLRHVAKKVICVSNSVREELQNHFNVSPEKLVVLENGIDLSRFPEGQPGDREKILRKIGINPEKTVLINVGRLDPQKNQLGLLQAFHPLGKNRNDVCLILAGGPTSTPESLSYSAKVEKALEDAEFDSKVFFLGWRDDISALLRAADFYVHAAAWEGFPLAMIEAFAARLPYIGTDCAGFPSGFEQGKHGWIVPRQDVSALRRAMEQALDLDEAQRREMGREGRRLAEKNYDVEKVASRFLNLVEEVMG